MMNGTTVCRYVPSRSWPVRSPRWAITCWTERSSSSAWQPVFSCRRRPTNERPDGRTDRQLTGGITRWSRQRSSAVPPAHPSGLTGYSPSRFGQDGPWGPSTIAAVPQQHRDVDVMPLVRRRSRNVSIINLGLTSKPREVKVKVTVEDEEESKLGIKSMQTLALKLIESLCWTLNNIQLEEDKLTLTDGLDLVVRESGLKARD